MEREDALHLPGEVQQSASFAIDPDALGQFERDHAAKRNPDDLGVLPPDSVHYGRRIVRIVSH